MPRPIQAIVHRAALSHNLAQVRQRAPGAHVWAVVKANAYGHGIDRVYPALRGADGFALLDLAEAERLRTLGWAGPILLLEGAFEPDDLVQCERLGLWHTVHRPEQIDWLAARPVSARHQVFVKLNGGMNRLGFTPAHYRAAWTRLHALAQVVSTTHMMHFSDADRDGGTDHPWQIFERTTRGLTGAISVCNSAATMRHGQNAAMRGDWVRPGIVLYGGSPDCPAHDSAHWQLQPAMTLRAEIIATQTLQAGDTVGYGSTFTAPQAMRIGVVACGYADGYPRHAPTGTPVLVDGVPSRTVGRVSMDMLAVDLSTTPGAAPGSEVVLWGRSRHGIVLPIDAVAQAAETIGYELMCAIAPRVPMMIDDHLENTPC